MTNLGSFRRQWRLRFAIVLAPLLAIVILQYVSSTRLAKVELIAHQTSLLRYLDTVAADLRWEYENVAREMLDVPGDALAAQRFDLIAQHFDQADTSAASLLFAGSLEGCSCLTQYYDPQTGDIGIGAEPALEAVIMRVSYMLRLEWLQNLNRSEIYVDELDDKNRVLYRFVTDADFATVGFAGFVIDSHQFEREYLPRAIASAEGMLSEEVRGNLIVRVTDGAGRTVAATHDESGQTDALTGRFDFVFRDLELSARSRHTAAAQVLQSNALTSWILSIVMSVMTIGGVLFMWRAARRERQLSRIRNGFVASVSHELRTPLTSIAVFGELLRCGRVTAADRVVDYGRRIEEECTRLRHLIDNTLSFGRIESARIRYRPELVAIEDVVGVALSAVDARRARERFAISVISPDAGLPDVRVDATAMAHVFVNLLDNAMKYSASCRRIRLELDRYDGDVSIAVTDGGTGIAPDDQEHVFEEFFRAADTSTNVLGTGLGLAIARHVVESHGGRIEVDSRLGHGATFTVFLPAATAPVLHQVDAQPTLDPRPVEARA